MDINGNRPRRGPHSNEGKRHISNNAVKHGLRSSRPLPCRQGCFYKDLCYVYDKTGEGLFIDGNCDCIIEMGLYLDIVRSFDIEDKHSELYRFVCEYAVNEVLLRRSGNYIALHPEMNYWAMENHHRLQGRSVKLLEAIRESRQ